MAGTGRALRDVWGQWGCRIKDRTVHTGQVCPCHIFLTDGGRSCVCTVGRCEIIGEMEGN